MTSPAQLETKNCESCGKPFTRQRPWGLQAAHHFARRTRCERSCGKGTGDLPTLMQAEQITYRQIDYWLRKHPELFTAAAVGGGTGRDRRYTDADLAVFVQLGRLTHAGMTLAAAARVAGHSEASEVVVRLSKHVVIAFEPGRPVIA